MDRDSVLRAHVLKHAAEPVMGDSGDQVRHDAELGATECSGDGVAAERDRIGRGNMLLIAGRHVVGNEGYIDIGLSDEECLHALPMMGLRESAVLRMANVNPLYWIVTRLAPVPRGHSMKLFANNGQPMVMNAGSRRPGDR